MVTRKTAVKKASAVTMPKKSTPVAAKPAFMLPHEVALSSNTQNAAGILAWSKFAGEANLQDLVNDLGEQAKSVQDGDMRPVEGMLYRQAKTLETIFASLVQRAARQENIKWFQTHLSLALKAQAQCRTTLEALAEIKNPRPVQFVKQANVTTGPQQINNTYAGASAHSGISPPAENLHSEPNKLLEADHGQGMVIGAQGQAGRVNQTVDAVETVHRAEVD